MPPGDTATNTPATKSPRILILYAGDISKRLAQIIYYTLEQFAGEGIAFIDQKDEEAAVSSLPYLDPGKATTLEKILIIHHIDELASPGNKDTIDSALAFTGDVYMHIVDFYNSDFSGKKTDPVKEWVTLQSSRKEKKQRGHTENLMTSDLKAFLDRMATEFSSSKTSSSPTINIAEILINRARNKKWKRLDLRSCQLKEIPSSVFELTDLEELNFYDMLIGEPGLYNNIKTIPGEISRLRELKKLNLSRNAKDATDAGIMDVSALSYLTNLETLSLSFNSIKDLAALSALVNLKALVMLGNPLQDISPLKYLKELIVLDLSFCGTISDIKVLQGLKKLEHVNLYANKITDISPLLFFISKGGEITLSPVSDISKEGKKQIVVGDNPINTPPMEVITQGKDAILKYFAKLKESNPNDVSNINYLKLILAGNSQVGKTYLSKFLRTGKVPEDGPSTHVLNIENWKPRFLKDKSEETKIKIFDFGGQDYYHDTHNLFYSSNTAYLLMWDTGSNCLQEIYSPQKEYLYDNYSIGYWLEAVDVFTRPKESQVPMADINFVANIAKPDDGKYDNPVLVLQNKIDETPTRLNQQGLKDRYKNIWGFYDISIKSNKRLGSFNEVLKDFFNDLTTVGRKLFKYQQFLLEKFSENKEFQVLTLTEFAAACNKLLDESNYAHQVDGSEAEVIANIMHNIGVAYFYKLQNGGTNIILNIAKFNEHIQEVMTLARANSGRLIRSSNELKAIPAKLIELLIHKKSLIVISDDELIVPNFLPARPGTDIAIMLDAFAPALIRYKYNCYFHKSVVLEFFNAYIHRAEKDEQANNVKYNFWKNGMVLYNDTLGKKEWVLIEFKKEYNPERRKEENKAEFERMQEINMYDYGQIEIRPISSFVKTSFIAGIESVFDRLNKDWTTSKEVTIDGINYFDVKTYLEERKEKGDYVFVENGKKYSLSFFKNFIKLERIPRKIFISYSSRDRQHLENFVDHLVTLRREELIEAWDDRQLMPGESWDEAIITELTNADIVILLLTVNFLNSNYIWEKELELAIQKGKKIVPIYVDYCTWEKEGKINGIQGLKVELNAEKVPVLKFPNQHEAWVDVINQIRTMILQDVIA